MKNKKLNIKPYKGTRDFYPEDMVLRNYIFDTWKQVCKSYGYEEYDAPIIEEYDLFAAKSGEELVNTQLYSFTDRGNRKVAIRPEMTPSLARMVASKIKTLQLPIRWFSIPNCYRYEKPQRGRNREFYQLNADIFGIEGVEADFEIIGLIVSTMKSFGATKDMFEIKIGNRRFLDDVLIFFDINPDQALKIRSIIDKKSKVSSSDFEEMLSETGIDKNQIQSIIDFMQNPSSYVLKLYETSKGAQEVSKLLELIDTKGLQDIVSYDPVIVRGLDYYTGNVFEMFDKNPKNTRAMLGGGRYDDLVEIFNGQKLTGTGFGWGDETMRLFLETWDLLPKEQANTEYLVTRWPKEKATVNSTKYFNASTKAADKLREQGKNVELWLEPNTKISKQIKYANKKGISKVVIIGEDEINKNVVTIKDLFTSKQEQTTL